jgi:hypothetical protein
VEAAAAVLFAFAVSSSPFAKSGAAGTLASSRMHIHLVSFIDVWVSSAGA